MKTNTAATAIATVSRARKNPSGYVLYENPNYVVVATMETENPKTGNMVQVWILAKDMSPVDAVRTGQDDIVCFDCKHRGEVDENGRVVNRTCYVKVFQAPLAVWNAYSRGKYPTLDPRDYKYVFAGRKIRLGAYGEPVLIPFRVMMDVTFESEGWTGYTHQWRQPEYQHYSQYLMASVDSESEYEHAKSLGWRTFRVRTSDQTLLPREISCPASDEMNHRTTCERCNLCNGSTHAADVRKDIAIVVHGSSAKRFIQLSVGVVPV